MSELSAATFKVDGSITAAEQGRATSGPSRIAAAPGDSFPWYVRLILAAQRRKYGQELEPARLWGRIPRSFLALTLLYRSIDRAGSPIAPGLRALIQVRVSQINGCRFCVDLNSAAAVERHVAPAKLAALADHQSSSAFDEREKAALAYADAMTDSRQGVDDRLFARLRRAFGEDEMIELTALVAFQNLSSKFNTALGVPAQGFCAAAPKEGP